MSLWARRRRPRTAPPVIHIRQRVAKASLRLVRSRGSCNTLRGLFNTLSADGWRCAGPRLAFRP
eukprot:15476343-Alexandrium_andersonii.AAC.1